MPHVTLTPVGWDELDVLRNLMQLYLYDFSQYFCDNEHDGYVNEHGQFPLDFDLRRYAERSDGRSEYEAFLSRVNGRWAGFALISSRVKAEFHRGEGRNMDEFFVLRCFRRQGVGRSMAFQTFDKWRGFWQVAQIEDNTPAQQFWHNVIHAYTGGDYTEVERKNSHGEMIVWQTFETHGLAAKS